MFDLNDFDETLPGPWEWDVKHLAASLVVAGRDNEYSRVEIRRIVVEAAAEYRRAMTSFGLMSNLEVWYSHFSLDRALPEIQAQLSAKKAAALAKDVANARTRDSVQALTKLARVVDGELRIVSDPPLIVAIEELLPEGTDREATTDQLLRLARTYLRTVEPHQRHRLEQFRFCHLARKVVGVGGAGTRARLSVWGGRDDRDPLPLQIKEAESSVLERFVGRSAYRNHGHRVVAGRGSCRPWATSSSAGSTSRRASTASRGISPSASFATGRGRARSGRWCPGVWAYAPGSGRGPSPGLTPARATGSPSPPHLGSGAAFDQAIADFAEAYADQNERDHAALVTAARSGRIKAETGP